MDSITLNFNIFQAAQVGGEARKSLQVENPQTTKIGELKTQLFSEEIKAAKSIRFIAGGRILDDSLDVTTCKLADNAQIHVSISDNAPRPSQPSSSSNPRGDAKGTSVTTGSPDKGPPVVSNMFLLGAVAFIITGVLLYVGLQKRRQFTLQMTQLLFIGAAVWAYLLICHGIPALFQALRGYAHSSPAEVSPKNVSAVPARESAIPVATQDEVSTTEFAPAAGLSVMAPTLPSGASASSILTNDVSTFQY
jgi:hypothetical protein